MAEKYAEKRYWQTPSARQKRVRILTWVIIAASALGPFAFLLTVTKSDPEPPPSYTPPLYVGAATVFVEAWINGQPSPLPVNTGLSPSLRQLPTDNEGKSPTAPLNIQNVAWSSHVTLPNGASEYPRELHRFIASIGNQSIFIYITIAGSDIGPVLVSDPAILPAPFIQGNLNVTVPEGEPAAIKEGLVEQLKLWAQAYGTDNRNTLLRLTGDPNGQIYPGLPGGKFNLVGDPTIFKSAVTPDGKTIVTLSVTYVPTQTVLQNPNDPASAKETTNIENQKFSMQFDLLIENSEQAFPFIVAWGPVGTGTLLTPYENALQQQPSISSSNNDPFNSTTTINNINRTTTSTTTTQPQRQEQQQQEQQQQEQGPQQ